MTVPVWVWLPDADQPVHAADLVTDGLPRLHYRPDYLASEAALALDPVELRLVRNRRGIAISGSDGLPGVLRDAKPAGYGADRLTAHAGRDLSVLELLERGVPDGVGAVEVCADLERKLAWVPKALGDLEVIASELDEAAPASRALRQLNRDLDTSAGGERPKATLVHEGQLWLAKMQDRGDRVAVPAREFVTMTLASLVGLSVADVRLHTFGAHQVLLVRRFDRAGDPLRPQRRLYASAHTVMRLPLDAVRGDARRSYLNLGDGLRVWARGRHDLEEQLGELWRRMAFNALVGNVDDHPLNHGFLYEPTEQPGWRLSPAFDITPALSKAANAPEDGPVLSMATSADGSAMASVARLLASAPHFSLDRDVAEAWLHRTASMIAHQWEPMLRKAAQPLMGDAARADALIDDCRAAFDFCERVSQPG